MIEQNQLVHIADSLVGEAKKIADAYKNGQPRDGYVNMDYNLVLWLDRCMESLYDIASMMEKDGQLSSDDYGQALQAIRDVKSGKNLATYYMYYNYIKDKKEEIWDVEGNVPYRYQMHLEQGSKQDGIQHHENADG